MLRVAMALEDGWSELFWAAFRQSRNPMVLLDQARIVIGNPAYRFVVGAPLSAQQWAESLAAGHFAGETELRCSNGNSVVVQ